MIIDSLSILVISKYFIICIITTYIISVVITKMLIIDLPILYLGALKDSNKCIQNFMYISDQFLLVQCFYSFVLNPIFDYPIRMLNFSPLITINEHCIKILLTCLKEVLDVFTTCTTRRNLFIHHLTHKCCITIPKIVKQIQEMHLVASSRQVSR